MRKNFGAKEMCYPMPVFIVAEVFVNIAKTIYGIATLCAILNAAYICVYLYGMRKKVES